MEADERDIVKMTIAKWMLNEWTGRVFGVMFYCGLLGFVAVQVGKASANWSTEHVILDQPLTPEHKPTLVLVRRYGEQMIFKGVDVVTGQILDRTEIHTFENSNPVRLATIKIKLKGVQKSK